jgi:hypothetical protein
MREHLQFSSMDELLRYVQERSDDIERVQIPRSPTVDLSHPPDPAVVHRVEAGMILRFVASNFEVLSVEQAEAVLNDGILNRAKIRIEFLR